MARRVQQLMQAGKQEEAMKLYQQIAKQQFNGSIELAGSVVDANGVALSDVVIVIKTARMEDINSQQLAKVEQTRKVDGNFDYACEHCAAVTLTFKKKGYYREKLEFVSYADQYPDKVIVEKGLEVVLQKQGKRVQLEPYRGQLLVSKGETHVLPFSFGPRSRTLVKTTLVEMAKRLNYSGKIAYLQLRVKQDADGELITQQLSRPGSSIAFKKPVDAVLDFAPADGGVIAYQAKSKKFTKIQREMSLAPETGYEPRLVLDLETDKTQFFYCRIGKQFCRGTIQAVSIEQSSKGQRARVAIAILLNPTAVDRNLEGY